MFGGIFKAVLRVVLKIIITCTGSDGKSRTRERCRGESKYQHAEQFVVFHDISPLIYPIPVFRILQVLPNR